MKGKRLVGDVGGTNARFAILDKNNRPHKTQTLPTKDYSGLVDAIQAYLEHQHIIDVRSAAIAVANPLLGDVMKMTNNSWSFSISETENTLGLEKLHVVNDFNALARAVPHLNAADIIKVGGGERKPNAAIAVIGPGTGLGVSGLVPCGQHYTALQGEGGHVSLGLRTPREYEIHAVLKKRFGHVSAERALSGPGLINLQSALREIDGLGPLQLTPAEITERACNGSDAICVEVVQIFCELLGSCAGNLVLSLGAEGGVYIGGGIVPKLGETFIQSGFRQQFEAKGRMSHYLEKIPSFVIAAPHPALLGVAQVYAEA